MPPAPNECFPGAGTVAVTTVMRTLRESGYAGLIIADHAPLVVGDSGWATDGARRCG